MDEGGNGILSSPDSGYIFPAAGRKLPLSLQAAFTSAVSRGILHYNADSFKGFGMTGKPVSTAYVGGF